MTEIHRIRLFEYVPSPIVSTSIHKNTLLVARDTGYVEIWSVKSLAHCMGSFNVTEPKDIRVVLWGKFRGNKTIIVCTFTGQILVYDYPSLKLVATTASFGGSIWGATINSDQNIIAVACDDGCVHIFDTTDDLQIKQTSNSFGSKCLSVCFDENNNLYAGDSTGHIAKIDIDSGRFITTFSLPSSGNDLSVWCLTTVIGGSLVSGDSNGQVIFWNPNTGTIDEKFLSHQADVLCLATKGNYLYAAGIDPTVITFVYHENQGTWAQKSQKRFHTHDVTSISINENTVFTSGLDSTIFAKKGLVLPFQNKHPMSIAHRTENEIIVAGSDGIQLTIWKLNGNSASLELCIKCNQNIDCLALSKDGNSLAYSSNSTRILRFDGSSWSYDEEIRPRSSSLKFSLNGILFNGTIDGSLSNGTQIKSFDFPIFHIAISSKSNNIVIGGLKKMISLTFDLKTEIENLPNFGSPFSTFEFQPNSNRLFISTSYSKILVYNVRKHQLLPKLSINLGKIKNVVAINQISFDLENINRILFQSSQVALIYNLKGKEFGKYRLPYDDFLHAEFLNNKKIVIFEKPWIFMMQTLPKPFRIKRFQNADDTKRPRY